MTIRQTKFLQRLGVLVLNFVTVFALYEFVFTVRALPSLCIAWFLSFFFHITGWMFFDKTLDDSQESLTKTIGFLAMRFLMILVVTASILLAFPVHVPVFIFSLFVSYVLFMIYDVISIRRLQYS